MFTKGDYEKVRWVKAIAKLKTDSLHRRAVNNCNLLLLNGKITNEGLDKILQVVFLYWTHVSKITKPENQSSLNYRQALELFNWATDLDLKRRVKINKAGK